MPPAILVYIVSPRWNDLPASLLLIAIFTPESTCSIFLPAFSLGENGEADGKEDSFSFNAFSWAAFLYEA